MLELNIFNSPILYVYLFKTLQYVYGNVLIHADNNTAKYNYTLVTETHMLRARKYKLVNLKFIVGERKGNQLRR